MQAQDDMSVHMQFHFDGNQDFQVTAIESVADLFDGQGRVDGEFSYVHKVGFVGIPNRLDIDEARLLKNLNAVQNRNGLKADDTLLLIEEEIDAVDGKKMARFPNFSVEMETGTGKTYVYIRTALELNRRYGFRSRGTVSCDPRGGVEDFRSDQDPFPESVWQHTLQILCLQLCKSFPGSPVCHFIQCGIHGDDS
jgi:Rad3-related DNA helicase